MNDLLEYHLVVTSPFGATQKFVVRPQKWKDEQGNWSWEPPDVTMNRANQLAAQKKDLGCKIVSQTRHTFSPGWPQAPTDPTRR